MSPSMSERTAADATSSRDLTSRENAMLFSIVSENRKLSCGTYAHASRTSCIGTELTS